MLTSPTLSVIVDIAISACHIWVRFVEMETREVSSRGPAQRMPISRNLGTAEKTRDARILLRWGK
jgi:hypothetical protein